MVRKKSKARVLKEENWTHLIEVECDLTHKPDISNFDFKVDAAYFLVHGMSTSSSQSLFDLEQSVAYNFLSICESIDCQQIIYLSGMTPQEPLSEHLEARHGVEKILLNSSVPTTVLKSAIVVGAGSASFEIMRDLVEKLPIMIAPKWLNSKCQPIAVLDCIGYMLDVLGHKECYDRSFDIGGPDVHTYRDLLRIFAKKRKLKRWIITVPLLTPKLSSLWLTLVTAVPYHLAKSLVQSLVHDMVISERDIQKVSSRQCMDYESALERAFRRVQSDNVFSKWSDDLTQFNKDLDDVYVPYKGCFKDVRVVEAPNPEQAMAKIWCIGGKNGWYKGNFLWELRGYMDKIVGGAGLRRGRRNQQEICSGDVIDFWRVLLASQDQKRLLLYAEMKLPGEAWLEFKLIHEDGVNKLVQIATFRPRGLMGRLYWYSVAPLHHFIFPGMARKIVA
jgi:uncharacterized protein YbjT (DUF2867 family)